MVDLLAFYQRAVVSTGKAVAGVRDDQLGETTPCAEWDVRAVGNHIIGGSWMFAGRLGGRGDEDYMAGDRVGAFREATAASVGAFARPGALEELVELPVGTMPGEAALSFALLDMVVHGWDLATATGQNTAIEVDLAGAAFEVAKRFVGDGVRGSGVFGPPLAIGDGAPVHERLVAFLGRTP